MRNINDNESEQKNGKMKKVLKKGVGIGLCAVLAGGLAAGTFEGVNRITGWNQTEDVQAARASGMNDHIAKPIDPSILAMTLLKYI